MIDRVHELGCYLETELSSYVGVLRARSTLQKERIRVRRMHGSASVGWPRHAYVMPAEHESNNDTFKTSPGLTEGELPEDRCLMVVGVIRSWIDAVTAQVIWVEKSTALF